MLDYLLSSLPNYSVEPDLLGSRAFQTHHSSAMLSGLISGYIYKDIPAWFN